MNKKVKCIVESGLFIAIAVILDLLFKLTPRMPNGGRISLTMLPLLISGYRNGFKYGLITGLSYGVINFMLDGFIIHWGSIFFDYLFAFGCLGLTGLFKEKGKDIKYYIVGILLSCFIRYLFHSLSGVIFFREADMSLKSSIIFSFILYNGVYMLGSTILCLVVSLPLHNLVYKELK